MNAFEALDRGITLLQHELQNAQLKSGTLIYVDPESWRRIVLDAPPSARWAPGGTLRLRGVIIKAKTLQ